MSGFLKRHIPVIAAIVVLILGGSVAALAAGAGKPHSHSHGHAHQHGLAAGAPRGWRMMQSAAAYVGIPVATLEADLHSGKSLGQVATEAGKTEAGLVQALATTARAGLEERIAQGVKLPGGIHGQHKRGHKLRTTAAGYLGITPGALNKDLRSGQTLAQIAESTPGHSKEGLVKALVAARRANLPASGLSPGTKNTPKTQEARLRERVSSFVDHAHSSTKKHKTGG
jgi:hypothetical protein